MQTNKPVWAVVPAAGIGSRMQADIPKQYLLLDNQTILAHTLQRLGSHPQVAGIVVAVAKDDRWWPTLKLELNCELLVCDGGKERSDSVLNALACLDQHIDSDPWLLVHDAARPCIRLEDIDHMLEQLEQDAVGGILGVPVTDTVKKVSADNTIVETVDRNGLWRAATPQMFRLAMLKQTLQTAKEKGFKVTDEASAIELAGYHPKMVEGHSDNIKVTLPKDLALASLFLQQQRSEG